MLESRPQRFMEMGTPKSSPRRHLMILTLALRATFVGLIGADMNPRSELPKFPMFGKTVGRFDGSTPNQVASVAAY
jgi:hypothetical protein